MLTVHHRDLAAALERHVKALAGDIGERNVFRPPALHAAADYILQECARRGSEVRHQDYQARGVPCANTEVALAGCVQPDEIIVVGAHYDTVRNSPGADDNASGVAAVREIAGLLQSLSPQYTVRCVAFVNEEAPFFARGDMGSLRYARAARQHGDCIRVMLSLEMLGYYRDEPGTQRYPPLLRYFYPERGNFIAFVSNLRSLRHLRWIVDAFRTSSGFPVEAAAGTGDEWVRIWGAKTSVNGGFEGGYMSQPYNEPFGKGGTFYGLPLVSGQAYQDVVAELARNKVSRGRARGWRCCTGPGPRGVGES
ncbi:M28 family peptidase [Cupriavidus necator]|uniref:M28 family peptidase n=1 Tax=Cupriavidus necator TaxID=106590 RepID=UPI0039C361BE